MKTSFLLWRSVLVAGAMFLSTRSLMAADPSPLPAVEKSGLPSNFAVKPELLEKKRLEHERGLAARAAWLPKLPAGAVTALDVPYVSHPAETSLPTVSNQMLDLFVPKGAGPFPLIVWMHGGAWKGGDKEASGASLAARWLPEGFAVASISYRYVWDAPFPGMFQDGIDSIAWLRSHAGGYHLDKNRIGVIGESAGANLAGVVAMAEGTSAYTNTGAPIQAAVLWAGFYDMTTETGQWKEGAFIGNSRDDFTYIYPMHKYDPEIAKKISPLYLIHPKAPPVLLIHGDQDTTAPKVQTDLFEAALRKAGIPVTVTNYPQYSHSLGKPEVHVETLAFFKRTLQGRE